MSELINPESNSVYLTEGISLDLLKMGLNDIQTKEEKSSSSASKLGDVAWKLPTIKSMQGRDFKATIRILPPPIVNGRPRYFRAIYNHWMGKDKFKHLNPLPKLQGGRIYCFETFGEECPICEVLNKARPAVYNLKNKNQVHEQDWSNLLKWQKSPQILTEIIVKEDSHSGRHDFAFEPFKNLILQVNDFKLSELFKNTQDYLIKEYEKDSSRVFDLTSYLHGNDIRIRKNAGDKTVNYQFLYPSELHKDEEVIQRISENRIDIEQFFQKDSKYDEMMNEAAEDLKRFIKSHFFKVQVSQAIDPLADIAKALPESQPSHNPDMYRQIATPVAPQLATQEVIQPDPAPPIAQQSTAIQGSPITSISSDKKKVSLTSLRSSSEIPEAAAPILADKVEIHSDIGKTTIIPTQQAVVQQQQVEEEVVATPAPKTDGKPQCYGSNDWGNLPDCNSCPLFTDCCAVV